MLYDKLDYLQGKVLYLDTDSITYIDDDKKNIKTGDMLSELNDELSMKQSLNSFQQDRNLMVLNMVIINKNRLLKDLH